MFATVTTEAILEALPVALFITDLSGRIVFFNPAAVRMWGQEPDTESSRWCGALDIYGLDGLPIPPSRRAAAICARENRPVEMESVSERPDGTRTRCTTHASPLRGSSGDLTGILSVQLEKTEGTDASLNIARLAAIVQDSDDAIISKRLDGQITSWNASAERIFGYRAEQIIGESITTLIPPELVSEEEEIIRQLKLGKRIDHIETVRITKDQRRLPISLSISPIRDEFGKVVGASKVARDLTHRKIIEESARANAERFDLLARATNDAVWDWEKGTGRVWWNEALLSLFGYQPSSLEPSLKSLERLIYPEDKDRVIKLVQQAIEGAQPQGSSEHRMVKADGSVATVVQRHYTIFDHAGGVARVIGTIADVTEQRSLAQRLQQSQKMDAIGKLTGGVAHDFNNLLTVVIGNAEMLKDELPPNQHLRAMAELVIAAGRRAGELTQRLLAFARQQALEPTIVDINKLVSEMDGLLRRTLSAEVDLQIIRGGGLWPALIDRVQLETAILNLAINAQDAMVNGGALTIETANVALDLKYAAQHDEVEPGQYVMVSVSDTGSGMSKEIVNKAFEPFFTTKEVGKGTGLGLSMVYGFIKQSSGHVKIYSEVGEGTTVKLYLPRATGSGAYGSTRATRIALATGSEKILVVEDDELVRQHVVTMLGSLGYQAVAVTNGPEAIECLSGDAQFDLLFTDVVLPGGMNGRQVAEAANLMFPELPVLFTSGYTQNAIVHNGRLDPGVHLLSKPYTRADLALALRKVLQKKESR
jgi:PAS domain S-box-containing protein